MVAAYVASTHLTYGGGAATTAALTASSSTAGDLAVVVLMMESTSKTITAPSGWTLETQATSTSGGSFTITVYLFWKYLTGSETASDWTFSWTGSAWRTADAISFRGGKTSGNPFGGTVGTATGTNGTRTSVAYTTTGAGLGFWIHGEYQDSSTTTLPSGYTSRHASNDHNTIVATRTDAAGSLSTGASTGPSTTYVVMAQTILDTAGGTGGSVTAVAATATAQAEAPAVVGETVVSGGGPATATALVLPPTVFGETAGDGTVLAPAATATALSVAPAVLGEVHATVEAFPATANASAPAPVVGIAQDAGVLAPAAIATVRLNVPVVEATAPTFRFEPPTFEAPMQTLVRPFNYFRLTYAASIVRINGTLTEVLAPNTDLLTAAGEEGVDYFLGGRIYDVSAATKAELEAAGYTVE